VLAGEFQGEADVVVLGWELVEKEENEGPFAHGTISMENEANTPIVVRCLSPFSAKLAKTLEVPASWHHQEQKTQA
jgi:hypothetical protein